MSPDAKKNNYQKKSTGNLKGGLTTKLRLCCTFSCPVVFRLSSGNSHDVPEGRKLIKSIYSKNNNYLLMDRAYEDDKTLAKNHGFSQLFHLKKIVGYLRAIINTFINNAKYPATFPEIETF